MRSVELERLTAEGLTLIERRNSFELMRDGASDLYETHIGHSWHPRHGSLVNRKALTAAIIDSRDFIAARRRAETEVMRPKSDHLRHRSLLAAWLHRRCYPRGYAPPALEA